MKPERLFPETMTLGESTVWDEKAKALYWVDILAGRLWQHDFSLGKSTYREFGENIGMCCLAKGGGLVAALEKSIVLLSGDTALPLAQEVGENTPRNHFNDGKCDNRGRLLAGTMNMDGETGEGAFYCLEKDQQLKKLLGGVSISNGLG